MARSSSNESKDSVRRSGCELGICALVLAILLCAAADGWADETASSSNAWPALRGQIEERQKSVKSFDVRFEEKVVATTRDPKVSNDIGRWIVQMKGDRQIHVEEEADALSPIDKNVYRAKRIVVSNGRVHKTYYPRLGNLYPGGYVDKEDETHLYSHAALLPIAVRYRMLEWMAAECPGLSNDQVSTHTGSIDGKSCVIASWTCQPKPVAALCDKPAVCPIGKSPTPISIVQEVYLDATREMVPLRVTLTVTGPNRVHLQWDLQYSVNDAGLVLRGWKSVQSDAEGHIVYARTAKVLQCKVNLNIDASSFDIQFPVGTYIEDKVAGENYILKGNSKKRRVTDKEWASGATYETLLHTEPTN